MQHLNHRNTQVPKPSEIRILQFGGGKFLRAFADWMIDIMNEKLGYDAGVLIVKPTAEGDYRELERQDGLFHVLIRGVENGQTVSRQRLINCVDCYVHPYQDFDAFAGSAGIPGIRVIISNTTEAGIQYREADRYEDQPAASFPGKLTQWLHRRYRHFEGAPHRGCIVLPCELIEQNGDQLLEFVRRHARQWQLEPGFLDWLGLHNHFCNTLVDRIVPGFTEAEAAAIEKELNFRDDLLVSAEPYHLWAIEGAPEIRQLFPADQARLNVQFVEDIQSIRTLKVRLLNGAHTAMVPLGLLKGMKTVREAIEDEEMGRFIRSLMREEVVPTLSHPRAEAEAYTDTVIERFRNPFLHHHLSDIAFNSTSKFQIRLLPSLISYFEQYGQVPKRISLTLAALIRFYRGDGPVPLKDSNDSVAHLLSAWKHKSPAEISRAALALWPIPDDLLPILQDQVADYLYRLDRESVKQLLKLVK